MSIQLKVVQISEKKENKINDTEKVILLSAFLHDIGKFLQRAQPEYKGIHPKWSAEFIGEFLPMNVADNQTKAAIKDIVLSHHDPSQLKEKKNMSILEIIISSDHLSSAEREKREDTGEPKKEPLQSPFCSISLHGNNTTDRYCYTISSLPISYPKKEKEILKQGAKKDYKAIQKLLEQDLKNFNELNLGFKNYINTLNYILYKHLRLVPSAVYADIPDVSLYDHLKTTAAIALCLYRSEEEKKFLLIEGDISGIQNFIFESFKAEESDKRAARRLRGKSFVINLLIDAATSYICEKLNLYEVNILWQAGGNFLILAPNSKETRETIVKIERDINRYLSNTLGNIYLVIDYKEGKEEDLKNFTGYLGKLKEKIDNRKNQKYDILIEETKNEREEILREEEVCVSCGRNKRKYKRVCETCRMLEDLGKVLSKLENKGYLIKNCKDQEDWSFKFGEFHMGYHLSKSLKEGETIFSLNSFEFLNKVDCSQGFRIIGNFAPTKKGDIICFSTLADQKENIKERKNPEEGGIPTKISILKTDIDDLGLLFSLGLEKNKRSVSRISLLSFLFDYFFSLEVNKLAEEKNVYVVFSGGDDLTVAGRFDEVISFTEELQRKFSKWTCYNPDIHISSGIELADHKFPVKRLITYAEEELKKSKDRDEDKNKITLFGETVTWSEFEEQLIIGKTILEHTKNNNIGRGFAFSLLKIREMSNFNKNQIERGDRILINPDPYVKYLIARNWKDKTEEGKKNKEEFMRKILDNLKHIRIAVSYFSLLSRYGGE